VSITETREYKDLLKAIETMEKEERNKGKPSKLTQQRYLAKYQAYQQMKEARG